MTFLQGLPIRAGSIEPRAYQLQAAENLFKARNGLLVMPTALGKTIVAALIGAAVLRENPKSKILFMAPTKPLAAQQIKRLREILDLPNDNFEVVTGENEPQERAHVYEEQQVIAATPQTIQNDFKRKLLHVKDFALIIVDEAHRAVGNYAYSQVSRDAVTHGVRVVGLTASPSSSKEKIQEICENLGVKHIEIKTEHDEDVAGFMQKVDFEWQIIQLPAEMLVLSRALEELLSESIKPLKNAGLLPPVYTSNKRELLVARDKALARAKKDPRAWQLLTLQTRAINILHATDLLEAQGVGALHAYLRSLAEREKKSKAVESLLQDPRIQDLQARCLQLLQEGFEHPKLERLRALVDGAMKEKQSVIIFAHFRETAKQLTTMLNAIPHVKAAMLVGRSGEGGLTQKEQIKLIEEFRERKHNVLVATSVGEEGLDIPTVDLIVFYEAVPSEVRAIQRRGRAGRAKAGRVVVLVAKGTKDEAFLWISRRKEQAMHQQLANLQGKLQSKRDDEEAEEEPTVFGDEAKTQRSMRDFL